MLCCGSIVLCFPVLSNIFNVVKLCFVDVTSVSMSLSDLIAVYNVYYEEHTGQKYCTWTF